MEKCDLWDAKHMEKCDFWGIKHMEKCDNGCLYEKI